MKLEDLKYINPGPEKILYYKELSEYIIPFIGKDGKEYATLEALQRANRKFDEITDHYSECSDDIRDLKKLDREFRERMLRVDKLPFYTIKPSYIGNDGNYYDDFEALQRANRKFDERMLRVDKLPFYTIPPYITPSYIGDDGNYYDNYEALEKANREFSERMNREIKYKFI